MLLFYGLTALLLIRGSSSTDKLAEKLVLHNYRIFTNIMVKKAVPSHQTDAIVLATLTDKEIPIHNLCDYHTKTVTEVLPSLPYLSNAIAVPNTSPVLYRWGENTTVWAAHPSKVGVRKCRNMTGCCESGQEFKVYKRARTIKVNVSTTEKLDAVEGTLEVNEDSYCECSYESEAFMCGCPEPFESFRDEGKCTCRCPTEGSVKKRKRCAAIQNGRKKLRKRQEIIFTDGERVRKSFRDYATLVASTHAEEEEFRYGFPECKTGQFDRTTRKCPLADISKDNSGSSTSRSNQQPTHIRVPTTSPHILLPQGNGDSPPSFQLPGHGQIEKEKTTQSSKNRKKQKKRGKKGRKPAIIQDNWVDRQSPKTKTTGNFAKLENKLRILTDTKLFQNATGVLEGKVLEAARTISPNCITVSVPSKDGNIWCSKEESHYPFPIDTEHGRVFCRVKPIQTSEDTLGRNS